MRVSATIRDYHLHVYNRGCKILKIPVQFEFPAGRSDKSEGYEWPWCNLDTLLESGGRQTSRTDGF